jgi:hypothetical protein
MNSEANFRIFVSYSHDDEELCGKLITLLRKMGFHVLCDQDISVGRPFTDAIKGLIAHAHVFMPLITAEAEKRPWIHQETGYAMARGIPILPLVTEGAEARQDMAAQLQAIIVTDDLSNLEGKLREEHVRSLVLPQAPPPQDVVRVADWPEQRSAMLAEAANRVWALGHHAMLRQSGALSSFCLPDKEISDPVWSRRDGDNVRGDYLHSCQRDERKALERHVRQAGCRLIIFPYIDFSDRGSCVRLTRLSTLLEFLDDMPAENCQVVLSDRPRDGNRTILGDWFVAESLVPGSQGYRQTVLNWHAPAALRAARDFDHTFAEACQARGKSEDDVTAEAVREIRRIIDEDRAKQGCARTSAEGDQS